MDNNNSCRYNKLETLCKEMSESLQRLKDGDNKAPYTIEPDTMELFVEEDHLDDSDDEFLSTVTIKLKDIKEATRILEE
jgi:hypothetical protein